jgi:two-component system chemotaxis response regulator CheY
MLELKENFSILVIDDEADVRETLCEFLTLFPKVKTIVQAQDGSDALRKVANQKFHIIVTDLMMPKMKGLEFIEHLRAQERSFKVKEKPTPIIILSANVTSAEVKKALQNGIKYVMTKPCSAEQFVEKIQDVCKKEYGIELQVDL